MLVKKNILILHPTDDGACAFYRAHFVASLLQSNRSGEVEVIVSPFEVTDEYVLKYTAAIVVFRPTRNEHETLIQHYRRKRGKFGYKIFADYDDLVFDVEGRQTIPEYNPQPIDTVETGKLMERCLAEIDGVTVSTEWLQICMVQRFGWRNVRILPNAVPRFCFGFKRFEPKPSGTEIEKPKVLYAGSACHFKDGSLGDFAGPWVPWLKKAVSENRIELHMFGVPHFLEEVKDRIVVHDYVSAVEFPAYIASIKPDFYLAPLQENLFNKAKSNLKLLEATAIGAVLIGSSFSFGPYEQAHELSKVSRFMTPDELDTRFKILCKTDRFNEVFGHQERLMQEKAYWMDSNEYLARYLRSYFGQTLNTHF